MPRHKSTPHRSITRSDINALSVPPAFCDSHQAKQIDQGKPAISNGTRNTDSPDGYHKWALWLSNVFGPPNQTPHPHSPSASHNSSYIQRHRPYVVFRTSRPIQQLEQQYTEATSSTIDDILDDDTFACFDDQSISDIASITSINSPSRTTDSIGDHHYDSDACSFYSATDKSFTTHHLEEKLEDKQPQPKRKKKKNMVPILSKPTAKTKSTRQFTYKWKRIPPPPPEPSLSQELPPELAPLIPDNEQICHVCYGKDIPKSTLEGLGISDAYMNQLVDTQHLRRHGYTGKASYWDPAVLIKCTQCKLSYHSGCVSPVVRDYPNDRSVFMCADCLEKRAMEIDPVDKTIEGKRKRTPRSYKE